MENWPLANCAFILHSREETKGGIFFRLTLSQPHVTMHSPAVSRADEVVLIVWMNLFGLSRSICPGSGQGRQAKGQCYGKNLGFPSTVREPGTGRHWRTSWVKYQPDFTTAICRIVFYSANRMDNSCYNLGITGCYLLFAYFSFIPIGFSSCSYLCHYFLLLLSCLQFNALFKAASFCWKEDLTVSQKMEECISCDYTHNVILT